MAGSEAWPPTRRSNGYPTDGGRGGLCLALRGRARTNQESSQGRFGLCGREARRPATNLNPPTTHRYRLIARPAWAQSRLGPTPGGVADRRGALTSSLQKTGRRRAADAAARLEPGVFGL